MDDFTEEDIKVLIKITLRTQTDNQIHIALPFHKKFCPETILTPNAPLFIPIFNTLELTAKVQNATEKATIHLQPILTYMKDKHCLTVQTYLADQPNKTSTRYTFEIQFAQIVVFQQTTNYLQVVFKKLQLQLTGSQLQKTKIHLRVIVNKGSYWTSKKMKASQSTVLQQSTTLMFSNLLDTVTIQIRSQNEKLCEIRKFIFELLGQGPRIHNLKGQIVKQGNIKISAKTMLPMMMIQ